MVRQESVEVLRGADARPIGNGQAETRQPLAHEELVLRVEERVRTGTHRDAVRDELAEHRLRDVLVVEGHDVHRLGEGENGRGVRVVADHGRGLPGGRPLGLRQHLELDAELDRGRDHHAGELPSAHDPNAQVHDPPADLD
ncbi:hypothetical protein GCM10025866_17900 [Naasia aerilata]|uniref:Uncharacterized protein n=1 Tax=Naasia aerilata TaxID=1162966 RepID=A0ABM8GCC9_9MICO|nr:hypothetical protein GCM10025866_17900 [Naasia aerilata]